MKYILASASPRRRELLSLILNEFEIIPATSEEKLNTCLFPEDVVCAIAENKCNEVFAQHPDSLVIGCDTVVVFEGEILGKPKDAADAINTLKRLSGKTHSVITAVCIRKGRKKLVKYDATEVKFNTLSDEFIKTYVEGGSPLDKAGSYGIQDGDIVKGFIGSYTNVVGMPVSLVKEMIQEVLK